MFGALVALLVADAQLHCVDRNENHHIEHLSRQGFEQLQRIQILGWTLASCCKKKPVVSDDMDDDNDAVTDAFRTCQLTTHEVLLVN